MSRHFAQLRLATPFSPALPWQSLNKLNDRRVAEGGDAVGLRAGERCEADNANLRRYPRLGRLICVTGWAVAGMGWFWMWHMSCLALTEPRPAVRSALAVGGRWRMPHWQTRQRQCGPFQLAEPTSAEMACNPSIGYVRPKVRERVRRSAGDRGRGRNRHRPRWS